MDAAGDWIAQDTPHGAVRAWQAAASGPATMAVVVVQEIFGVNAHVRHVVARLAEEGFDAVAPALFDPIEPGVELGYDAAGVEHGRALAAGIGFDRAIGIVGATTATLRTRAAKVAVVGFCWGGTVALLSNTRLGLPCVDYYGGRSMPFLHEPLRAPALLHFGSRDPLIPGADVQAHRDAHPCASIHVYDAGHGFNCDARADFDADAASLAWSRTLAFLRGLAP